MDKKILNSMFENLLHIGNKTNYWSPKMKPYIYGSVNWVHIINLIETAKKIEEIKNTLKTFTSEWKKILFVATKLQSRDIFARLAVETNNFYVTEKWVPWLLTNFKTIKRRINTYLKLLRDSQMWSFDVLTKKEKASKMLELSKLDRAFKWLKNMKKIPEVLFIVDGVYEKQAVKEWNSLNIPTFAILNTNGDDSVLTNIIPANTNSVKSIGFIAWELKKVLWQVKEKAKSPVKKIITDKVPVVKKEKE